jgi:hypothetical protein
MNVSILTIRQARDISRFLSQQKEEPFFASAVILKPVLTAAMLHFPSDR